MPVVHRLAKRIAALLPVLALAAVASGESPPSADDALLAHWSFDQGLGVKTRDVSGNGLDASLRRTPGDRVTRTSGLLGDALLFTGDHFLGASNPIVFEELRAFSVSAWVIPTALDGYREIFRKEDGDRRVLFSFQHGGTVLSLGLNVGGYFECDAKIEPDRLRDGRWHHCAATYDGEWARVYFDGEEIGALHRPGRITAGGPAPACIGSTDGRECFQGAMDELQLYARGLTSDQVSALYAAGADKADPAGEPPTPADEPSVPHPLLAHWTFNETGPFGRVTDVTGDPDMVAEANAFLVRRQGVYGNAAALRGNHAIRLARFGNHDVKQLTFSAWVRPTDLPGYREIFRQDCDKRVLFSFQENGRILSLGLNVREYVECDAVIDPASVLDGSWHHCAATFDGHYMRVYLDGREVGALERVGELALDPDVPAFIGSSRGISEQFQGRLDDLRIYAEALTADEIAALHQDGVRVLALRVDQLDETIKAVYPEKAPFAETCALLRERAAEQPAWLTDDSVEALSTRLRSDFPDACTHFTEWTGASPLEYILASDDSFHTRQVSDLMDLLTEYKPVTEAQWKRQTPEDIAKWNEADRIRDEYETLLAAGDAARFSPKWIDIVMAAGPHIQFRPHVREPVAPYRKPSTPETRTLTAEEARDALERDWLHQADGDPTPERINQEIAWTRHLAARIAAGHPNEVDYARQRADLDALAARCEGLTDSSKELYFAVRDVKRAIMFANPVLDFDGVLFVDRAFPQGSEWPHETRHRLGYMAVPGGKLVVLKGLHPGGEVRQLMPQDPLHGSFWRPDLSFDATKVLFCFKPHNEKSFHLYEINVDGTGLVQLTDGPYDDLDPIYLPDGEHIVFSTTRAHTYVRCMPPTNAFILARCERDGRNIYLISGNNEPDYLPSVMDDGRIIYTRWEYTDKPLWRAQSLWTVNPDGSQPNTFWGNQSVWPDLLKDARNIPGSHRVMFTGSAHHNWFNGSVGIIDHEKGFNFPNGLTKVTADVEWPESGNGPVDPVESPNYHTAGKYKGYYSPYPLSETDFIVSANRGDKFVLYLMDVDGNRELIYEGSNHVFHAVPLRPRPTPPVIVDRVVWPTRETRSNPPNGVIYSTNVYQGAPEALRGKARYLRVLNIDPKTYTYWHKRPYLSTGPVVSAVQSEGVKRVLGTVPIESDGSVVFHAPPGMALHFQLLDENYRALQTMRSFVNVMPGESRGCLGCHELHSRAPAMSAQTAGLRRDPSDIEPPPWGVDTVSYLRYVRPVLDKHCAKCHEGEGKAREVFDMTERPGSPIFTEPYLTMIGKPTWGAPYKAPENPPPGFGIAGQILVEAYSTVDPKAYVTPEPMTALSYKSRLVAIASSGKHHGVKVDEVDVRRLAAWVDTMCPYRGEEEVRSIPDPEFQGVDWLAVRPRIASAPEIVRPGPVD